METAKTYENFPLWMVPLAGLVTLAIYGLGGYVVSGFGMWPLLAYVLFCVGVEVNILWSGCRDCYYLGKRCGLGRGKLAGVIFSKGDPQRFAEKDICWLHLVPDFLVFLIPLAGGIFLLLVDFRWVLLLCLIMLSILATVGNAVIRGQIACKYCKQKEIGCPAEKLFNREKPTGNNTDKG